MEQKGIQPLLFVMLFLETFSLLPKTLLCLVSSDPNEILIIILLPNSNLPNLGAPIAPGYQSHYVVTNQRGKTSQTNVGCDEIVINQEAQVRSLGFKWRGSDPHRLGFRLG